MRLPLIASCSHTLHRAMRLCFRGFIAAKNIHVGGEGRGALLARTKGRWHVRSVALEDFRKAIKGVTNPATG